MACCRTGSISSVVVWALAGIIAVGAGGYSVMTGKTPCSLLGSCESKSGAAAVTVANTETATSGKSCCALSKAAAVTAAKTECAEKATECDKTEEAKVVNAANVEGAKASGGCCKSKAATAVNASNVEGEKSSCAEKTTTCSKSEGASVVNAANVEGAKASGGCCKSKAATAVNASNVEKAVCPQTGESNCTAEMKAACASSAAAVNASMAEGGACVKSATACSGAKVTQTRTFAWGARSGGAFIALPVFFTESGEVKWDCSGEICPSVKLVNASGCDKASSSCTKSTNVSADEQVCPVTGAKATPISATETATTCKQKQDGCTGDGKNGCDGKEGKCPGETEAKPANATETETVAARPASTN